MWILRVFLMLAVAIWYAFGGAPQHKYIVIQENMTLSDVNTNVLEVYAAVYKVNESTNALNFTFKLKINLPEDSKILATAYRWMNNQYRFCMIQISKTIKSALQMEMFDLDSLVLQYSRPPLVWPLEQGVTYRSLGWSPDSSKFPANLPEGKWKVPIAVMFGNKTTIVVATWYLRLKYIK